MLSPQPVALGRAQKPTIVGYAFSSVAGSSLTINLPKECTSGLLAVTFINNFGGTSSPLLPLNWTGAGANNATATRPGNRVAYKFLNGSESSTTTSSATSATSMTAMTLVLSGCVPSRGSFTTHGSSVGTSASPDPPSLTVSNSAFDNVLWITQFAAAGSATVDGLPQGFSARNFQYGQEGSALTVALCAELIARPTVDPSPWTISTSLNWISSIFGITA